MAAALEDRLGVTADLVEGEHGVFDIAVDGHIVFSKKKVGTFISTPEMVERVSEYLEAHGAG